MEESEYPFPLPTIEQIEEKIKTDPNMSEVLPCYRLAPYPEDPMSLLFLKQHKPEIGDIIFMDLHLLHKILNGLPPMQTTKGDPDIAPGIARFLARHRLVIPHKTGLALSVLGEFLLTYLNTNPPLPWTSNFPIDFDLSQLPDQDKYYGLKRHSRNQPEQD